VSLGVFHNSIGGIATAVETRLGSNFYTEARSCRGVHCAPVTALFIRDFGSAKAVQSAASA
jgi:hypothetical protein